MQVFVSDIHLTDAPSSSTVSDAELVSFIDRTLTTARGNENEKVTLVLVGDIFDFLRSPRWTVLWREKSSAPWSGMSKRFSHFKNSFAENRVIDIAIDIRKRYSGFSRRLRELVAEKRLETVYVPGNHDFMVQLSPDLRKVIIEFLGLKHDPDKPFKPFYENKSASVFAVHGNSVDPVNWHRQAEGYWAMGDGVVILVVNRFPEIACQEIGCAPDTEIGQLLQEIDNVQPLVDVPIYVRWFAEKNLTIKASRAKVLKAWSQVVEEFLAVKEFRDREGYARRQIQLVRRAFQLSTKQALVDLVSELARLFPNGDCEYPLAAEVEAQKNPCYRFVLFGHTHKPMLQPLTYAPEGRTYCYVNTGCWKKVVMRTAGRGPLSFAGRREGTYFVINDSAAHEPRGRYHLFQEWHTS